MTQFLQDIFQLEDSNQFEKVFDLYSDIYSKDKSDYEIWKHYYFFLWSAIEDTPSSFQDKIGLRKLLEKIFNEGKQSFDDKADFNFLAGYTVSIFPYEYGDYDDLENEGIQMLLKATQLEPDNKIYKMVYMGSLESSTKENQKQTEFEAASKVLEEFCGNGLLNRYFRAVLYRNDKKPNR
jgi:hypothetical protein